MLGYKSKQPAGTPKMTVLIVPLANYKTSPLKNFTENCFT